MAQHRSQQHAVMDARHNQPVFRFAGRNQSLLIPLQKFLQHFGDGHKLLVLGCPPLGDLPGELPQIERVDELFLDESAQSVQGFGQFLIKICIFAGVRVPAEPKMLAQHILRGMAGL